MAAISTAAQGVEDTMIRQVSPEEVRARLDAVDLAGINLFGVPKGGALVAALARRACVVYEPGDADVIVDDIEDSGSTRRQYEGAYPAARFVALFNRDEFAENGTRPWIVFPWERHHPRGEHAEIEDGIRRLLEYIGCDPRAEGLIDTPARVLRALRERTAGYQVDVAALLGTGFAAHCDEMVVERGIRFASTCEHHLMPFFGTATVGYVPNGRVVGISKLARVVEAYAARLQLQERMTTQIAEAVHAHLEPLGVGVLLRASHTCMACRGARQPDADLITSSLLGIMRDTAARAEFMGIAQH